MLEENEKNHSNPKLGKYSKTNHSRWKEEINTDKWEINQIHTNNSKKVESINKTKNYLFLKDHV